MMKRYLLAFISNFLNCTLVFVYGAYIGLVIYTNSLPKTENIHADNLPSMNLFYSSDFSMIGRKYSARIDNKSSKKRIFVPITHIPDIVKYAFISAEDKNFYNHSGISFSGIIKALVQNIFNIIKGHETYIGASTITQQIIKNIILTNEKTLDRKIREALLAFRISHKVSKDTLLEIYLNEIFFGANSYGVQAASLTYFSKMLNQLSIAEAAMLASLPKAPSKFNPYRGNIKTLQARRNWVIFEMFENGYISKNDMENAQNTPIILNNISDIHVNLGYFLRQANNKFNSYIDLKTRQEGGLYIHTTLNHELQEFAQNALEEGLRNYDEKTGFHGVLQNINFIELFQELFQDSTVVESLKNHVEDKNLEMNFELNEYILEIMDKTPSIDKKILNMSIDKNTNLDDNLLNKDNEQGVSTFIDEDSLNIDITKNKNLDNKKESLLIGKNFFDIAIEKEKNLMYQKDKPVFVGKDFMNIDLNKNKNLYKIVQLEFEDYLNKKLSKIPNPLEKILSNTQLGVVTKVLDTNSIEILTRDVDAKNLVLKNIQVPQYILSHSIQDEEYFYKQNTPKKIEEVLIQGDVIILDSNFSHIYQYPKINGAILVMNHNNGNILALSGGYHYNYSTFDRALQGRRQPGSVIKPFVYLAGLEAGLQPNSIIVDSPISIYQGKNLPFWKPNNYGNKFSGPIPMRMGLEKSKNAMTVRMVKDFIGLSNLRNTLKRVGLYNSVKDNFSISLGSQETSLLNLVTAYSSIVNGGYKVTPQYIDYILNRQGKKLYVNSSIKSTNNSSIVKKNQKNSLDPYMPPMTNIVEQVPIIKKEYAYQVLSMLEGVVKRGTGYKLSKMKKNIGGKTGTTNKSHDLWFVGFNAHLVVGIYVGYDTPKSLGHNQTGSSVAMPIFEKFMQQYYTKYPNTNFSVPENISIRKIDRWTGLPPTENTRQTIYEAICKSCNVKE